jgi:6-phosphogluconolactonase (cycloisomerase 2 family)
VSNVGLQGLAHRLKSSAAKLFMPPGGRRAPLLFDALEPRLLLSATPLAVDLTTQLPAQQDHQVLVRLVDTVQQTQTNAATQQRIEIIDQASGTVLASSDANNTSAVAIVGGAGNDQVIIDGASFAGHTAPAISFDGGGGNNTVQVTGSQDSTWQLGAAGAGAITGATVIDFTNVNHLIAGSGNDTLQGSVTDTNWQVTGAGSGTVSATSFAGFEKLVGAADNHDTFTFQAGGSMAQGIDGGAGGYDTLVVDAHGQAVVSTPAGPQSGTVTVGGQVITYAGLEPVTITGSTSLNFFATGPSTLSYSASTGLTTIASTDPNSEFEAQSFNASQLTSLTINGGLFADLDLDLQSIDPGFNGTFTVNATGSTVDQTTLDSFGLQSALTNIVRVSGNFNVDGGSVSINAERVLIGTVIDTPTGATTGWTANQEYTAVVTTGGSGTGMTVDVTTDANGDASVHVLNAGSGYAIGDTVSVNVQGGAGSLSFGVLNVLDSGQTSASVNTGAGSVAMAGSLLINAFDIRIGPDAKILAQGAMAGGAGDSTITITASNENFRYLTMPISWEFSPLAATIDIAGSTIAGSAVTIEATSEDIPGTNQLSASTSFGAGYLSGLSSTIVTLLNQYAAGYISSLTGGISPSVVVHKTNALVAIDDAIITATSASGAGVTIEATTNVDASGQAYVQGLTSSTSKFAAAVGFGLVESDARTLITGTTAIASQSTASIETSATGTVKSSARTSVNLLGSLNTTNYTFAIGVEVNELTSLAQLGQNASIVAAGAVTFSSAGSEKTGSSVSTQANIDGNLGISIGVGVSNATVKTVVDGDITAGALPVAPPTFNAATAVTLASAPAGAAPPANSITIPNHGFTTGEQVVYNANGGTPIAGLDDGAVYYVIVIDANTIQLSAAPSLDLTAATGGAQLQFSLNTVNNNAIYSPAHGFTNGEQVTYLVGQAGAAPITGLTAGATYTVQVIDANDFQLLGSNGQVVQISQGTASGLHGFEDTTTGNGIVLNLASTQGNVVTLANHGLLDGETVQDGSQTYVVHVIDANDFELATSAANAANNMFVGLNAGTTPSEQAFTTNAQTLALQAGLPFALNAVNGANAANAADDYSIWAPGNTFSTGDQVVYTAPAGSPAITGLTSGATYTVNVVDDSDFQLLGSNGQVIQISQGAALGYHSFVSVASGDSIELNLAAINASQNEITIANHGFTEGEAITYGNLTDADGTDISNLGVGTQYYVHVVDANNIQLADSLADLQAGTFENVVSQGVPPPSLQAFQYTSQTFVIDAQTAVNSANDTITIPNHGLQTGDMLVYNVHPNVSSSSTVYEIDPTTLLPTGNQTTVLQGDPEIGGLTAGETYYVVVVDANTIRLVSSPEQALLATPVVLTAAGSGAQYITDEAVSTSALTITATLKGSESQSASSSIGGTFGYNKYAKGFLSKPDLTQAIFQNGINLGSTSPIVTGMQDVNGVSTTMANYQNSWTGGIGVAVANHDVEVTIGADDTGGNTTSLVTGGNLTISSTIAQSTSMSTSASVSKPNGSSNVAGIGISVAVGVYANKAIVTVAAPARIDAGGSASIASSVTYPPTYFTTADGNASPWPSFAQFQSNIQSKGLGGLTYYDDGMLGLSNIINNSATTSVAGGKKASNSSSYGLSLALNFYDDTSKTTIETGAQINQRTQYVVFGQVYTPTASQSVTVSATNAKSFINAVGNYSFSLSDGLIFKVIKNRSLSFSDVVSYGVSASGKGVGAGLLGNNYDNDTEAVIQDGVKIHTGTGGSLNVTSSDSLWALDIAEGGASVSGGSDSVLAGAGSFLFTGQQSTVKAAIQAGDTASTISGGAVNVSGTTTGTQIAIAGALGSFSGSGVGVGIGAVVSDLSRSIDSYIGIDPMVAGAIASAALAISGGAVSVSSTNGGLFLTIGVAGTYDSSQPAQPAPAGGQAGQAPVDPAALAGNAGNAAQGLAGQGAGGNAPGNAQAGGDSTGFGLAGSVNVFILDDTTDAAITGMVDITTMGWITSGDSGLTVTATDDTDITSLVGGAALGLASNSGGSKMVAGAVNVNDATFDTEATLSGNASVLTAGSATVSATNTGAVLSVSAGIAVDDNAQGTWAVAGSVAVNRIADTTEALIDSITALSAAALSVNATSTLDIHAYGGGLAISKSKTGVGAGIAVNNLTSETTALIQGSSAVSTLDVTGALDVSATNDNTIVAIGVTAAIGLGQQESTSLAGTFAVNVVTDLDGTPVTAGIRQSVVTAGSVAVDASDTSDITSIAGAIAVGSSATGVGAALSWNEVSVGVDADIEYASVATTHGGDIGVGAADNAQIVSVGIGAAWTRTSGTAVGASLSANIVVKSISATVTSDPPANNSVTLPSQPATISSAGDLSVSANDTTVITAINGGGAVAGGESTGAGVAVAVNIVAVDMMQASIDGGDGTIGGATGLTVEAGGDIDITASESSQIVSVAAGFALGNTSLVGSVTVSVVDTQGIAAQITGAADVTGDGNVRLEATNDTVIRNIAGDLAIGTQGGSAYGIGVAVATVSDSVKAHVDGNAMVSADGGASFDDISGAAVSGLSIEASSTQSVTNLGVGGSISGQGGTTANISVAVSSIDSDVEAYIGAPGTAAAANDPNIVSGADVNIVAEGSTFVVGVGGALAVSGGGGGAGNAGTAGVAVPSITRTVEAYIGGGNNVAAAGNVVVKAAASTDIWSGSLALSGSQTIAAAASTAVTVLTFTTTAYVAAGARITAQNNVAVTANDSTDATQISGSGALTTQAGLGVGVSFGYNKIDKTTSAYIDSDAIVTANALGAGLVALNGQTSNGLGFMAGSIANNQITIANHGLQNGQAVVYNAPDSTSGDSVGGLVSGQTYYVKVIDANTISLAATPGGSVIALTAPTNGQAIQSLLVVALGGSTGTQTFNSSAVSGNEITAANHGFVTGQQIVYTAGNQAIGGLASGQTYYVIAVDANHFELATSAANAAAGVAIGLDPTVASGAQTVAALPDPIQTASNSGVGLDETQSFTGQQTGISSAQKGVIVSAVSLENLKGFGVGIAISAGGGTAVAVAGDWTDDYVTTLAYINDGAQINADTSQASTQQDVAVTAGHSYSALMVAGSVGIGSQGAVMPALARIYLQGVTQAYIQGSSNGATTVNARDSVSVTAQAKENVISIAGGIGGSSGFAVAGSLSWVGMDLQTQANIEGPVTVLAGGNVLVGADDETTVVNVGGSVAIGTGSAGIGGGGGVVIIDKLTAADIGGATVDGLANGSDTVSGIPNANWPGSGGTGALRGVAVEANSSETVTNVGGSAGGASSVGIYGGVTVESVDSVTSATLSGGARINQHAGAGSTQAVDVSATNTMDVVSWAGALAFGGSAGVGAGVDVGSMHNNTTAIIGADSVVAAQGAVSVNALDDWTFNGHAVAGAASGSAGIAGSVVVYNVGGGVNTSYQTDSNGDGVINSADASSDVGSSSIGSFLDQSFANDIASLSVPVALPTFNSRTAVDATNDTIELGGSGYATGQTVTYNAGGAPAIGGLTDGQTYYVIADAADPTRISLAATLADALNGTRIALTPAVTGTTQSFTPSAQVGNQTASQAAGSAPQGQVNSNVLTAAPIASGTTAGIDDDAAVASNSVSVLANQTIDMTILAGSVAGSGSAGIGAGIAIVYVDADVQAYVGSGTVLIGTGGAFTVSALRTADLWIMGAAGGGGADFGLGAAVVVMNDHSNVTTLIGASEASGSSVPGPTISGYGTTSIAAQEQHTQTVFAGSLGGGIAGVGVTVLHTTVDGDTDAEVGAGTSINATGAVTVSATRTLTVEPPSNSAGFIAASIGIGAGAAAVAYAGIEVDGGVSAQTDGNASIVAGGAATVQASDTIDEHDMALGSGVAAAVGIGVVYGNNTIGNSVNASVGSGGRLKGSSVVVNAADDITASFDGFGAGVAATANAAGLFVKLGVTSTTTIDIGSGAQLVSTGGDIDIGTDVTISESVEGHGYNGALFGSGGLTSVTPTLASTSTITIESSATLSSSGNIDIDAVTDNSVSATSVAGGGALYVAANYAAISATVSDTTTVLVGAGASLTAARDLSVSSQSSDSVISSVNATTISALGAVPIANDDVTFTGATTTTIDTSAILNAQTVEVTAEVAALDLDPYAEAFAGGAYGYVDAEATVDVTSGASVNIAGGASITGSTSVTLSASQASLTTTPTTYADAWNLIATPSAISTLDATITTNVTVAPTAQIFTRALTLEASVPSGPDLSGSDDVSGGLIDIGTQDQTNNSVTDTRTISFNGTVTMLGAIDPTVTISADGTTVTTTGGATATVSGNTVTINAINGAASSAAGTITFVLPASSLDNSLSTSSRALTGAPTIKTIGDFANVIITNNSTKTLQIGAINAVYGTSNAQPTVTGIIGSSFTPTYTTGDVATNIVITGTTAANIVLAGAISNPYGSTTITSSGGSILSSGGSITGAAIVLSAAAGSIGASGNPISIGANGASATSFSATALNGVYISALGGLVVGSVTTTNGTVSLTAASLTMGVSGTGVAAQSIALTTTQGGMGTSQSALLVHMLGSTGTFNVQAVGSIFITETSGPLTVNNATSSGGNVTLTVTDSAASGENLVLASGATVRAQGANSTVTLQAGDNIVTSASSTIQAQSVSLVGDYGDQDPATGSDFDLEGTIGSATLATAIAITGGIGADRIALRRLLATATLTINSGVGGDSIYLGSTATPSGASGGTLANIQGTIKLLSGSDDAVVLDDSGDTLGEAATLSASQVTGMGMAAGASVQFGTAASLQLQFGSGNDTLAVTGATSNVSVDLGAGNDQVTLAGAGNSLAAFGSQITINGGTGSDTLNVVDTGDTTARSVAVTGTSILGLTPGNASGGFFYNGLEQVDLSLGTAADTVAVTGTSAATTINGGGGADSITVGSNLSQIAGNLTLVGDGLDNITVSSALQVALGIGTVGGQTQITVGGQASVIGLSNMSSLTLALAAAGDTLAVSGSTTALAVQASGGGDAITVSSLQAASTFTLGGGNNTLTVSATSAAIGVTGGSSDMLVVDESAKATGLTGTITGSVATGLVHGLTTGDISFAGVGALDVLLGSGNDTLTLNESFSATALQISGGAGDDSFIAQAIGSAATMISGDAGNDKLTLQVSGLPANNAFTSLALNLDQLVVDDSANTTVAVAWTVNNGEIQATPVAGGAVNTVVSLAGVGATRIIGGTQQDTLAIVSSAGDVDGTINGNHVELRSGLDVLSGDGSASYVDYTHAMTFDGLATSGLVSYTEDGYRLSVTGSGSSLVRSDTVSPSLTTTANGDVLTLISANANGTATGNAFALYSLSLQSATTQSVTFTGITANGSTVTTTITVQGGPGFQTYSLGSTFAMMQQVSWTASGVAVDNVVAQDVLIAQTAPAANQIKQYQIAGNVTFNTGITNLTNATTGLINGSIVIGSTTLTSSSTMAQFAAAGIVVSNTGGIMRFAFAGDLVIANNVIISATGTNALSLYVGDDAQIGTNVTFNLSASGTTAGAGGGSAGGANTATGSGGSGGSGGAQANGGSGGSGGYEGPGLDDGGRGDDGGSGSANAGANGANGTGGSGGASGTAGVNASNSAGAGGAGGTVAAANNGGTTGGGGGGGGGGAGAFAVADNGGAGAGGNAGNAGTSGNDGGDGSAGQGGANTGAGATISGGGGGGAGGAGAGGQGGGGGASGTGGGGGGGGGGINTSTGIDGADGGTGGAGANGGAGSSGGVGGAGGAGGGALEIVAMGRITVSTGSSLQAQGGSAGGGSNSAQGASGSTNVGGGTPGGIGGTSHFEGNGGDGGTGGNGAVGGAGGSGGDGAAGGGGAGGTIKLYASDIVADGVSVNTSGGAGGTVGGNGRLIIGGNTSLALNGQTVTSVGGAPTSVTGVQATTYTTGVTAANAMVANSVSTPDIADWQFATGQTVSVDGGAAIYGLLDGLTSANFAAITGATMPSGAMVAVIRLAIGPGTGAENYTGYDMLLYVNLTDYALSTPKLGVGETAIGLLTAGIGTNAAFGGSGGAQTLSVLGAHQIWATLIPESSTTVSASVGGVAGTSTTLSNQAIAAGQVLYISAQQIAAPTQSTVSSLTAVTASSDGHTTYAVSNNTLVVANADGSQRQVLQDGSRTGGTGGNVSGLTGASDVAVSANGQFVYVTSSTADTIAIFSRSTTTGDLTFLQTVSGTANTYSTLTLSADGTHLYAGGPAGLTAYTVNPTTGALSGAQSASGLASLGVNEIVQSADGSHLFVATASSSLAVLDSATLVVTQTLSGSALGLAGASDLALTGNNLYVTSATGNTLAVFTVAGSTLTYLQTLSNGVSGVRGLSDPTDVVASADGTFILVSGEATDSVSVFQRATDGKLTFVQIVANDVGGVSGIAAPTGLFVSGSTLLVASADGTIGTLAMNTAQAQASVTVVDFSAIESVSVVTGAGNDTITISAAPTSEVSSLTVDTGDGNDHVWVSAAAHTTIVDLGAGNDQADISYTTSGASVTVDGGDGNDQLNVTQVGAGSTTVVSGDAGNDTVEVLGSVIPSTATVTAHGGTGVDTLQFDPQDPTPGTPNYTPTTPNPNAGTLQVTGQGVLTYDTFDGTSIVAAPIISVPQTPVTIAEGGTLTLTVAITPLGTGNHLQSVMWDLDGSGTFQTTGSSSITLTWAQLSEIGVVDDGTYSVWVRATNADGVSTDAQVTFVVTNTEPTIALHGAATTAIGTSYGITFSASDPGQDTVHEWQVDWGDGTVETFGANATGASHTYEAPGAQAIAVSAYDEDSIAAAATATMAVTVQVLASQISAGGPYAMTEGQGVTLSAAAPGTPSSYVWTVNGHAVSGAGTNGQSLALSWAQLGQYGVNDNGTFTVSVQAAYADGSSATAQQVSALVVANAAPTATLTTSSSPIAEGQTATVSFVNATDASSVDAQSLTYSYFFGEDVAGAANIVGSTLSTVNIPTALTGTPGTYVIHGRVTDKDGASTDVYTTFTVTAVAPALNVTGNATTVQGATYALSLSANEAGNDSITQWVVDWGDGNSSTVNGATATLTHVFMAVGSDTIHVTAVDSAGTYTSNLAVTVQDAPPVLSNLALSSVAQGQPSHLTGTVSDPGNDPLTVKVTWSDGTVTTQTLAAGAGSFDFAHAFSDVGAVSAQVVVSDGPAGNPNTMTTNGTANAVIANVPPTVDQLSFQVNSINEGAQATLVGKVTDPGAHDVLTVSIAWGDGQSSTANVDAATGLFQATHTYNDRAGHAASDLYTASVTAHDDHGGSSLAATATVTVNNVTPSLTGVAFSPAIVNEGSPVTVSGTIVDPGVNDTHTVTVAWGDGTATTLATVNPDGTFTATHTYANNQANNAPYAVVLTVADDDGASVSINASIEVDNVPPAVTLSGAGSATVGTPYALAWSAIDPGADTISGWQVDWGDGTVQTYAGTATGADHVYQLPGTYTMSVVAADNDAPNYTYAATTKGMVAGVTGADVSAGGPYATVQGGSVTLAASAPGAVSSYSWDLNGDGRADVTSRTSSVTLSWAQLTQMGLGDVGRFSVTVTATYVGSVSVTSATAAHLLVTNTPPTVADLAFSAAAQAGQPVTVSGKVVDPGTADIESVMVAWGDGTATMATVNADRTFSAVHTYADNPTNQTTYTVTLVVADDNGGSYRMSASLTVANVPPTVSVTGTSAATIGQTYTLAFSATDPANDPVSGWQVDWGDGTIQTFAASATGASHVYQTAALYEVSVSALDAQALGYYPTATKLVVVPAKAPVIPVVPAVTPAVPVLPVTVVEAMANSGGNTTNPVGLPPVLVINTAPQLPSVTVGYTPVSYSSQPQLQPDSYVFSYGGGDRGHSRTEAPKTDRKPQQQQPQNQDGQRGQPETRDAQQPSKTDGDPKGPPGEQPGERGPASPPPGDRDAPQNGQDGADHGAAPADEKSGQQQQNERTNDGATAPGPAPQPPAAQPPAVPGGTPQQQGEVQKPDRRARTESPDWVYLGALAAIPAIAANDGKSPAGWSIRDKAGRKRVA